MAAEHKLLRLLQLASPQFPIGAYAYSQGLEWVVESGVIHDEVSAGDWIVGLLQHALAATDVPLLARLQNAFTRRDTAALAHWSRFVIASRESSEELCSKLVYDTQREGGVFLMLDQDHQPFT